MLPVILVALRWSLRLTIEGRTHVESLTGPVVFAANHLSHMDTPAIYTALPGGWRYRIAPAMAREFFSDWFRLRPAPWHRRLASGGAFILACQCFNAFPLPQRQSPRAAFRYMRELVDAGYSILIYPEGKRVDPGEIAPFRRGVGILAADLGLPVVPVRIDGLDYVFPRKARIPRRGPVRIAFGPPLRPDGDSAEQFTARLEGAIRAL
jgi:long-chain acyl-CoA synthetase